MYPSPDNEYAQLKYYEQPNSSTHSVPPRRPLTLSRFEGFGGLTRRKRRYVPPFKTSQNRNMVAQAIATWRMLLLGR